MVEEAGKAIPVMQTIIMVDRLKQYTSVRV
jgi:hypothetical protein